MTSIYKTQSLSHATLILHQLFNLIYRAIYNSKTMLVLGGLSLFSFSAMAQDSESDIIRSTTFNEPENIDYSQYSVSTGLNSSNSLKIGEFTIRDGGSGTDSDGLPTVLSELQISVTNPGFIETIAFTDDDTLFKEGFEPVPGFGTYIFSSVFTNCPDDDEKSFSLYATFTSSVTDNEQIRITIGSASSLVGGSSFAQSNAGGAQTSITGDDNRIEVTATSLNYTQQPTDVNLFEPITPAVTLETVDGNGNLDLDYSSEITVFSDTGTLDGSSTLVVAAENGVVTYHNLVFSSEDTDVTIKAFRASEFLNTESSSFNVGDPAYLVAIQDFDSTEPEWIYTNNTTFFDNGWGTDGYYNTRSSGSISPLNFEFFSNNVLAENALDDTNNGNGTSGFARLTFDNVNISGLSNVRVVLDWEVQGYSSDDSDIQYGLILDDVADSPTLLFDGNNAATNGKGHLVISVPGGTTDLGFFIEMRNTDDISGYSALDNIKVIADFDGLYYRNSTWFPSAPTASTGADDVYVHSSTYTVSEPIAANNFTSGSGSIINVNAGETVDIAATLQNNGTLTLNSSSSEFSSIKSDSVSNNGTFNYNRYVNVTGSGQNDLISFPLLPESGQSFDEFIALGSPANSTKIAESGGIYTFGPFNNSSWVYEEYSTTATTSITQGIGYRAASTTGTTLTFSGDILFNDISNVPIDYPTNGSRWNLLGNPYPSYIDAQAFLTANSGVIKSDALAIYGYHSGTNSGNSGTISIWTIINNVSNTNVNIAPGQGFFVSAPTTADFSDFITFNKSMRTLTGTDDFILGREEQSVYHLNLKLTSNNQVKTTDIYFHDNCSLGLDPGYDASIFGSPNNQLDLYSLLAEDNQGVPMAIQCVNLNDIENVIIPLGIHAPQGTQIDLSINETDLPEDIEISINHNQDFQSILNSQSYTVSTTQNLPGNDTFNVIFTTNSLSTTETILNDIDIISQKNKTLIINGLLPDETHLNIYDFTGRTVYSSEFSSTSTTRSIQLKSLATGPYIVQLNTSSATISEKIIIRE